MAVVDGGGRGVGAAGPADRARRPWGWLRQPGGSLDPVILLTGLVCLGLAVLYLPGVITPATRRLVADYHVESCLLALVLFAIRHGFWRIAGRRQRQFWNRLTAAFACWLAGDAIYAIASGEPVAAALSVLADAFYFCFYLLVLLALEQRPHLGARSSEHDDLRRFRIAGSLVVLTALLCYFVVIPVWLSRPEYDSNVPSFLLFVALDALLVLRLTLMLRESGGSAWRWIYGPLLAAMSIWVVVDALDGLYYAEVLPIDSGTLLDFLYYAPYFLLVLATRARNRRAVDLAASSPAATVEPERSGLPGLLVFFLLALPLMHFSVVALGWDEPESRLGREVVIVLGLLSLCGLALAHELGMRRRTRELRRRLDDLLAGERLESVQRLESLGVLAGGIAHDFNNLLVSILGNADLLLRERSADRGAREKLGQIRQAALQAADLANQMLTYAGRGEFLLVPQDLNGIVTETTRLLESVISKKAELRFEPVAELPPVAVDAVQVRQLIMNLVTNASEALGDGAGRITVRTGVAEADATVLAEMQLGADLAPGRFVAVSVTDSGGGMTERTRRKMFDPFFTTKFPGRGLGLAAVVGIVRAHGGALDVASAVGSGTTVRVLLPVARVDASKEAGSAESVAASPGGSPGTVLVVEDEDVVRRVVRAMLETLGFEVIEARDGREGVMLFRDRQDEIDVVLLDLTMPVLDGAEALAHMQRTRPEVPVFIMSGYDDDSARRRCSGLKPRGFLRKPFRFEDLRASIGSIPDRDATPAPGSVTTDRVESST